MKIISFFAVAQVKVKKQGRIFNYKFSRFSLELFVRFESRFYYLWLENFLVLFKRYFQSTSPSKLEDFQAKVPKSPSLFPLIQRHELSYRKFREKESLSMIFSQKNKEKLSKS